MGVFGSFQFLVNWTQARFTRSERGASLVEYALLVALIAVACIVAVQFFGTSLDDKYSSIGSAVDAAPT
jgi:pilus assembly protein Flp/PilA